MLIEINTFSSRKCIWKCRLEYGGHLSRLQCINNVNNFTVVFENIIPQLKDISAEVLIAGDFSIYPRHGHMGDIASQN